MKNSSVFRVLPFKKSVHLIPDFTPELMPILFWVSALPEFAPRWE
jgi:hypothetical protein